MSRFTWKKFKMNFLVSHNTEAIIKAELSWRHFCHLEQMVSSRVLVDFHQTLLFVVKCLKSVLEGLSLAAKDYLKSDVKRSSSFNSIFKVEGLVCRVIVALSFASWDDYCVHWKIEETQQLVREFLLLGHVLNKVMSL